MLEVTIQKNTTDEDRLWGEDVNDEAEAREALRAAGLGAPPFPLTGNGTPSLQKGSLPMLTALLAALPLVAIVAAHRFPGRTR